MKLFETDKEENFTTKLRRLAFNSLLVYRGTRARLKFVSSDWKEVHVLLPLNIFTRNIVGTVFGGSIYSSVDPIYMLMFMKILGTDYVVWDKAATIKFIRPARTDLKARFLITDDTIKHVINTTASQGEINLELVVEYLNKSNEVCATIKKTLYIATQTFYSEKRKAKNQPSEYTMNKRLYR